MPLDGGDATDTRSALADRASGASSPSPAPSAPSAPAAPAIESTPAAPAALQPDPGSTPGSPAPGSTPETVPTQPAAPAQSEDELRQHAIRVAGGEANLHRWVSESNNRLAEQAARIKELEARASGQPAPTPAVPGQAPVATPGTVPGQPPAAPDPGAFVAPSPEHVEVIAHRIVQRDPEMNAIQAEYHESGKLVGNPDRGVPGALGVTLGPGGYRVPDLDRRIATLSEMTDPAKAREAGLPPLDELQLQDVRDSIAQLQAARRDKIDTFRATQERREWLSRQYQARYDVARGVVMQDADSRAQEAAQETTIVSMATEMARAWPTEFQAAVRAANVDERLGPVLWERIKLRGRAASVQETEDLGTWMRTNVAAELADMDGYHRLKSGEYSRKKEADAAAASGTAQPSTPSTPASPPKVMSYEEARERTRSALEQRAKLRQSA